MRARGQEKRGHPAVVVRDDGVADLGVWEGGESRGPGMKRKGVE